MDLTSIIGIVAGVTFILVGQILEGGNIGQLLQITAAFIVFGGTLCATILNFDKKTLLKEFYNVLYPFTINYNSEESYYPEFNLENGKNYLNQIKKYLDK